MPQVPPVARNVNERHISATSYPKPKAGINTVSAAPGAAFCVLWSDFVYHFERIMNQPALPASVCWHSKGRDMKSAIRFTLLALLAFSSSTSLAEEDAGKLLDLALQEAAKNNSQKAAEFATAATRRSSSVASSAASAPRPSHVPRPAVPSRESRCRRTPAAAAGPPG